jgi:hypothetical protein
MINLRRWMTFLAAFAFAAFALPAAANHVDTVTVTPKTDCSGFEIAVTGAQLCGSGSVRYKINLMPTVGPSFIIAGSIPVMGDVNCNFSASQGGTWPTGANPNGATLNGTATLKIGTIIQNTICFPQDPSTQSFQCGPNNTPQFTQTVTCGVPCSGAIGDFVWNDLDQNGIQDTGEPGIGGVLLALLNSSGMQIATATTTSSGYYQFNGLCAGSYTVTVDSATVPLGFVPTISNAGSNPANDSNGSPAPVTLPTNSSSDETIDFGYHTPPCSGAIGDFVWNDLNQNGIQDAGEPGIGGVKLTLANSSGMQIATATTTSSGYYQFSGLCAGSYRVTVDSTTLPPGFVPTISNAGSNPANDSNGSPAPVTLPTNSSSDQTIDFGYHTPPGKTVNIGPSSMEGSIKISNGDWVNGGYSMKSTVTGDLTIVAKVTVTGPCSNGGTDSVTVPLATKTYPNPKGASDWLPTGDANSVLSWQGSVRVGVNSPSICGGTGKLDASKGAVFTATVSANPPQPGSTVTFRFKYRDPMAKGKPNTNCLDTSDPNRARADVCGASWSETKTFDP